MSAVLVVAAHPDDEVLGCGGTIARHSDAGDQVQVLIAAEGATSRQQQRDRDQASHELSALAQAAHQAGAILGAQGVELLDLPDNRLDSLDRLDLIKQIEERIARHQPEVVYVHHAGDVNIDHLATRWPAARSGSPLAQPLPFSPIGLSTSRPSGSANARLWRPTTLRCGPGRMPARSKPWNIWPIGAAPRWAWKLQKRFACCGSSAELLADWIKIGS